MKNLHSLVTIIAINNLSRKTRFSTFFDEISITSTISRNLILILVNFDTNNEESLKINSILKKRVK